MDVTDLLRQTGGFDAMARELGVSQGQAEAGAERRRLLFHHGTGIFPVLRRRRPATSCGKRPG